MLRPVCAAHEGEAGTACFMNDPILCRVNEWLKLSSDRFGCAMRLA